MTAPTTGKVRDVPGLRRARSALFDKVAFGLGALGAVWLAVELGRGARLSLAGAAAVILMWAVLAYLALPRLNRMMTAIYVPDYFIGRTRTSDGLLGDPLNLAIRGSAAQLATAMRRAKWTMADPVTFATSVGIVRSTLTRRSYPEAPVSPLMLFDRVQDAAYQQEVEGNPARRHHVRFWRTPEGWPLPGGTRVDWLAAGTYDRSVGFSLFTLQITHKIDADIDVERDHMVASLTAANPEIEVEMLHDFTTSYHTRNGGGDSVHTDGDLPVLDVSKVGPDADAPELRQPESTAVPLQVWLPVVLNLVLAPALIWSTVQSWPEAGTDHWMAALTIAGAVALTLMSVGLLIARSTLARRILVAVAVLVAATHLGSLTVADTAQRAEHQLAAMVSILMVVALSSPKATAWTLRRDQRAG